jgi:hypothetical protein
MATGGARPARGAMCRAAVVLAAVSVGTVAAVLGSVDRAAPAGATLAERFVDDLGHLVVTSDAADPIVVTCTPGGLLRVDDEITYDRETLQPTEFPCASITRIELTGGPGPNILDVSGVTREAFTTVTDIVMSGFGATDTLVGGPLPVRMFGNDGDDVLTGGAGPDLLSGGPGRDTVRGGPGDDRVVGDEDADVLVGDDGDDVLEGGVGDDLLGATSAVAGAAVPEIGRDRDDAGPGDDTVVAGATNVRTVVGGDGLDTVRVAATDGADLLAAGPGGVDLGGADLVVLDVSVEDLRVEAGAGDDAVAVVAPSATRLTLDGGAGADRLTVDGDGRPVRRDATSVTVGGRPPIVHAGFETVTAAGAFAGYWLAASDGGIFTYGNARFAGSTGALRLNAPVVAMAATVTAQGYWLVGADGGVFAFGDAGFVGTLGNVRLNQPITAMARTASGRGYWLVAADGGVFAFGDAPFLGSPAGSPPAQPVVGLVPTPTGRGYWLVTAGGAVLAFGDAEALGGAPERGAAGPFAALAATPTGDGYWLAAADGRVLAFGDAPNLGGVAAPNQPVVDLERTPSGAGYWLVAADGGVFAFGDAVFHGSAGALRLNRPIVAAVTG